MAVKHNTHQITEENKKLVLTLSGYGIPQADIAREVKCDLKTLRKHYRNELDTGITKANAKVAESLFKMATVKMNPTCAIFWAKTRMGWKEVTEVEHSGALSVTVNVNKKDK